MTIKKTTAKEASTPETSATPIAEIIKNKNGKSVNKPKILNCPKCNRAYKKQDSLDKHINQCDGRGGGAGGWQGKGGRPKGSENEKTKELKAIKSQVQMQIAGKANQLVAAQFRMAVGTGRLFVRREVITEVGKGDKAKQVKRIEVKQVLDDSDFYIYLGLEHDENGRATDKDTGDEYYYMVAREGNPVALANMLDRAFGKPKESMDLGNDPDAPLPTHGTGTTTELRKAFVALVKQQIKDGGAKQ